MGVRQIRKVEWGHRLSTSASNSPGPGARMQKDGSSHVVDDGKVVLSVQIAHKIIEKK
jgi:hypothetical protein